MNFDDGFRKGIRRIFILLTLVILTSVLFVALCTCLNQKGIVFPCAELSPGEDELSGLVARVEEEISALVGREYTYKGDAAAITHGKKFAGAYEALLGDAMKDVSKASAVSIDGEFVTFAPDEESAMAAIDAIVERKNSLFAPHDARVIMISDVQFEEVYCLHEDILEQNELLWALAQGDDSILGDPDKQNGESENPDELYSEYSLRSDPEVDPDVQNGRFLQYETVTVESELETIEPLTVYITSNHYPVGVEFVRSEGEAGFEVHYYEVHRVNGEETSRTECGCTVTKESTDRIVVVGTHETVTNGFFVWPTNVTLITSRYKEARTILGSSDVHGGVDIGASYGAPVWASDGGEVVFAGRNGTFGNLIIIDHGNNFTTYYAHLSEIQVEVGDKVFQGEQIGLVGQTGRATGPHLHFEVRLKGKRKNPLNYISKKTCRQGEQAMELYK